MSRFLLLFSLAAIAAVQMARAPLVRAEGESQTPSAAFIKETDVRGYVEELKQVSSAVSGLAANPSRIAPLETSLPKAWLVRAPGQSFTVSTEWLTSTLSTMESTPKLRLSLEKDLLVRLMILRQEAEAFDSAVAERDDAAARPRLAEILKGREFASVSQPGWFQSLAGRVGSWIVRMLRRILRPLAGFSHSTPILVWGLAAILFLVLAFLVVRIFMRTSRTEKLAIEPHAPTGRTWRDWAREALEAAARRDFRDAIHRGYWAGVYRLQDLGVLKMEHDRTPREYLRILAGNPPEESARTASRPASGADVSQRREALAALTRRLEVTWYGCQAATDNDFRATVENLEALGCRFPSILPTAES